MLSSVFLSLCNSAKGPSGIKASRQVHPERIHHRGEDLYDITGAIALLRPSTVRCDLLSYMGFKHHIK